METTALDKTSVIVNENSQTAVELHQAGATVVGVTSLLLGGWAIACMTAGVIASGNPVALVTEYFKVLAG